MNLVPRIRLRFRDFLLKVTGETDGGRCRIWVIMGGHDLHDVLLSARVPFGRRPGPGVGRGGGAHLNPGVHVGFVIEADIEDVLIILRRARERLQADVEGSPVSCEGYHLDIVSVPGSSDHWLFQQPWAQRSQRPNERSGRRRTCSGYTPPIAPSQEGTITAMVLRPHALKDQFHRDRQAATGTRRMTGPQ